MQVIVMPTKKHHDSNRPLFAHSHLVFEYSSSFALNETLLAFEIMNIVINLFPLSHHCH
jgi:hypothetical protein